MADAPGSIYSCTFSQVEVILTKDKDGNDLPTTCSAVLADGAQCATICGVGSKSVGAFTCSGGLVLGGATCAPPDTNVQSATVVASTIKMSVEVTSTGGRRLLSSDWALAIEHALEDALGSQMLSTTLLDSSGKVVGNTSRNDANIDGSRRLAVSVHERRLATAIDVRYEAVVLGASTVTAAGVAERGFQLTQSGSVTQKTFMTILANPAANSGLPALNASNLEMKLAPRTFQTTVAVSASGIVQKYDSLTVVPGETIVAQVNPTEEADVAVIIGGVLGGLIGIFCCCGLCYCYYLMRKRLRES